MQKFGVPRHFSFCPEMENDVRVSLSEVETHRALFSVTSMTYSWYSSLLLFSLFSFVVEDIRAMAQQKQQEEEQKKEEQEEQEDQEEQEKHKKQQLPIFELPSLVEKGFSVAPPWLYECLMQNGQGDNKGPARMNFIGLFFSPPYSHYFYLFFTFLQKKYKNE